MCVKIGRKRGRLMEIQIGDDTIACNIIKSNRKSMAIEVTKEGEVLVRVPKGIKDQDLNRFIKSHQRWIYVRVMAAREREPLDKSYETGRKLLYLGQEIELQVEYNRPCERVYLQEKILHVWLSSEDNEAVPKMLELWYRTQARRVLKERTNYYAKIMKLRVNQITIKNQKTRWGSCSTKHNLNYNYRLVMAIEPVIDYVVIHELCHMIHMNHSALFWNEVEKIQPQYKQYKAWLKTHQDKLQL